MNNPYSFIKICVICISLLCSLYTWAYMGEGINALKYKNKELQKVLSHYQGDTLRYRAALFLIENMDAHYSLSSDGIDAYYKEMDSVFRLPKQKDQTYREAYIHASTKNGELSQTATIKYDHLTLTSELLIHQIDAAFDMWQRPWNKDISFQQFCEYVLPYRITTEPVSDWRKLYVEKYKDRVKDLFDAQPNHTVRFGMFHYLNKGFYEGLYYPSTFLPELPLTILQRLQLGNCESNIKRSIAQLRAFGIPAALDFTPQWGNRAMGHSWGVLFTSEDHFIPFGFNERLGIHFSGRHNHRIAKVYRHTFSKQEAQADYCADTISVTPESLHNPCIIDVTDKYVETSDITVNIRTSHSPWVYLCVFDNQSWIPVCVAKRQGDTATFVDMGRGIAYLPASINKVGELIPLASPFVLKDDGKKIELAANTQKTQKLRAVRKYTYLHELKDYARQTVGGKFQVANNEDFSDSITVATITETKENRFHSIPLKAKGQYRYFRYLSPKGSYGNMAEVEVYDEKGEKLSGIKMFGKRGATSGHKLEMMFDGDPLTSYNLPFADGGWGAMEFEQPSSVAEVRYLPRNDGNHIEEGDTYQLYYWANDDWQLLCEQKGNREGVLMFDKVPSNALLLLHDATKGSQERVFTCEGGEQVWW